MAGQNVKRNLIGPLPSEIITNAGDYGDTMSTTELEVYVSLLSALEDHLPPSSPCRRSRNSGRWWRRTREVKNVAE